MNQNNLELSTGKDGVLYLRFEDVLHGDDVTLEIHLGGRVFQSVWDSDKHVLKPTSLFVELRNLASRLEQQQIEAVAMYRSRATDNPSEL